jgi:NAD(P)-dependent dehydrogenase (short-subunit alcohol dehydrogenase family)
MIEQLEGRVVVVTGGSGGIGRATALKLAANGAKVVIAGRNTERGDSAVKMITDAGGDAIFVQTDVRYEAKVGALFERAITTFGSLDGLFNNAGIEGTLGSITECPEAVCEDVLSINVKGVFLCIKHAIPAMLERGGGAIVNTASFVGTTVPFPDGVVYGASKAAVLSITASVAVGFANQGIRVYAVCPWITDTPMANRLTGHQAEAKAQFAKVNPSGQIVKPEDVAGVVVAMLADAPEYNSGDAVLVDSGGITQKVQMPQAVGEDF